MGKYDDFVSLDPDQMSADDERFGRGKKINRLKVTVGTPRVIRILRGASDTSFYRVRSQHWGIPVGHGNTPPLSCSKKHADEPCYFCEQVNEYYNSGDPRQQELARRMKASVSVITNVIDVKDTHNEDGTPKVLLWQHSWKLFQDVRSYFRNPDYGDLTHPMMGRNFKITASVVSSQGDRQWTNYALQVGASPSELEVPEALEHLYDLDSTFPVKLYGYGEQQMIWDGTWNPRSGTQALPASAASVAPKLETTTVAAPTPAVSVDDEFEADSTEDEFESAPTAEAVKADTEDEWDDLLGDEADTEKQKAIRNKLDKLKKAAKGK